MANNRLILYHRPTGHYVYLGKRMGWGWYLNWAETMGEQMQAFYQRCIDDLPPGGDQDDFILLAENRHAKNNPFVCDDWRAEHKEPPEDGGYEKFNIVLGEQYRWVETFKDDDENLA